MRVNESQMDSGSNRTMRSRSQKLSAEHIPEQNDRVRLVSKFPFSLIETERYPQSIVYYGYFMVEADTG